MGSAHIAAILLRNFWRSELQPGFEPGLELAHTLGDILLDKLFEVKIDLPLQVGLHARSPQQRAETMNDDPAESHQFLPLGALDQERNRRGEPFPALEL